ncbi:hypothetical protein ACU61A_14240 [Pseudonocardia sichuanensis]
MSSVDLRSVSRGARHACRPRRWAIGLGFAMLLLLQVAACQALLAPSAAAAASTSSATVTACQHGTPGQDLVCEPITSAAAFGQRGAARDHPMTPVDAALVVLVAAMFGAAARAWSVHGPSSAQRLAPWGRDLLQSVGIARI